jgi:hypothetical protein
MLIVAKNGLRLLYFYLVMLMTDCNCPKTIIQLSFSIFKTYFRPFILIFETIYHTSDGFKFNVLDWVLKQPKGFLVVSKIKKWSKIGLRNTEGQLKNRFLNRCSLSLTSLDKSSEILARFCDN